MKTKKGLSPIITTILLILIALIAVLFIYSVVVPFVKDLLSKNKMCYKTQGQLEINTESGYTCHYVNSTANGTDQRNVNITIKRGMDHAGIEGFIITISGDGSSKNYKIKDSFVRGVVMYGIRNELIEIPAIGEERTYSITTNFKEITYATVTPIVEGGATCPVVYETTLEECATY